MLDFLEAYFIDILAFLMALASAIGAVFSSVEAIKTFKDLTRLKAKTAEDIQITQDGIVNAFKLAKIPNELKVSINEQIDAKLETWAAKFLIMFEQHEKMRTELAAANTKILAYTAAFNKLSEEEKAHINELIKLITDKDRIVEV